MKHIFAVSAYTDSPYLEACIKSLKAQTFPSEIILCTSTPSDYINAIAQKYNIRVFVREGKPDIAQDWNFAYRSADADLVTIAHQDDMYTKEYAKTVLYAKKKYPDMSLFTSASMTVKNHRLKTTGEVEIIKRILRLPLGIPELNHLSFIKKLSIMFGNPIICPSCTYDKRMCGQDIFRSGYHFVLDWELLIRLAKKEGRWICTEKPLLLYRIHEGAATKQCILNHDREREESEMFDRLLPKSLSKLIKSLYRRSYGAYS